MISEKILPSLSDPLKITSCFMITYIPMISPCYDAVQPGSSDFYYQLLCQFLIPKNPKNSHYNT